MLSDNDDLVSEKAASAKGTKTKSVLSLDQASTKAIYHIEFDKPNNETPINRKRNAKEFEEENENQTDQNHSEKNQRKRQKESEDINLEDIKVSMPEQLLD